MRFRGMFLWAAAMVLFGCFFMFSQPALACGDSPPAKGDPVQIEALTPQAPVIMDTACVAVFNLQAPTNMDLVYVAAIPALPESRDAQPYRRHSPATHE